MLKIPGSSINRFMLCSVSLDVIPMYSLPSLFILTISPAFTTTDSESESISLPLIMNITCMILYRFLISQNRMIIIPSEFGRSIIKNILTIPIMERTSKMINGIMNLVFFSLVFPLFPDLSVTWNFVSDIPSFSFITGISRNGMTLISYIQLHLRDTLFPPITLRQTSWNTNIGSQYIRSSSQLHLKTGIMNTAKKSGDKTYIRFFNGEYQ